MSFVCNACGVKYGTVKPDSRSVVTIHEGTCDICGESGVPVTRARHYGHFRVPAGGAPRGKETGDFGSSLHNGE